MVFFNKKNPQIMLPFLISGEKKFSTPPPSSVKKSSSPPFSIHNECILCMTILPVLPQFLWNLKYFVFSGSLRIFSLELFHIPYYIYSSWKVYKRMRYELIYSGTCSRFLSTASYNYPISLWGSVLISWGYFFLQKFSYASVVKK